MGDKLLRKYFLFFIPFFILHATDYSTQWIDKAVEEIRPPRVGVEEQVLQKINNPFVYGITKDKIVIKKKVTFKKSKYQTKSNFRVTAILNKSAKINNRWVRIGKRISGYTLSQINKEYVILQKADKKPIKVYINRKNRRIKLNTQ